MAKEFHHISMNDHYYLTTAFFESRELFEVQFKIIKVLRSFCITSVLQSLNLSCVTKVH